ncbi:MAG: hypothetical protein WCR46_16200 [Deltaproteobacteria bacterium]|jgi:hypothetical protein
MNDRSYENIDVVNYLDMNAEVVDGKLRPYYDRKPDFRILIWSIGFF